MRAEINDLGYKSEGCTAPCGAVVIEAKDLSQGL
jgi:hypothetical protein